MARIKITITIEDSLPWYAPLRTLDEYLQWYKQQVEYEQRRLEIEQNNFRWDWITQNTHTF